MISSNRLLFIIGGTSSGKSLFAEQRLRASHSHAYYIATIRDDTTDKELLDKIKYHQKRRDHHWSTICAPFAIARTIQTQCNKNIPILIDGLDLWCAHNMMDKQNMKELTHELVQAVRGHSADVWMVSSEVGMGTIASHPQTRLYTEQLGWIHQQCAAAADDVITITAGLPLVLKGRMPK